MRVHHLNCGCMCPIGGALLDGYSRGLTATLVCHCLLIETEQHGLILVDTGFGTQDLERPRDTLSGFFLAFNRIQREPRFTAVEQVRRLGFSPRDVRHIVLTHLDFDHAGGLEDFPDATVHVMQREMDAARAAEGFIGKRRYRARQWQHVRSWAFYEPGGDRWFGFEGAQVLRGLPPELVLVPLTGHTPGHAGIAVRREDRWLLHAGDAYFYRGEMRGGRRRCPPGLRVYQQMIEVDRAARLANQLRLRLLSVERAAQVEIFCAHDAIELKQMIAASERARRLAPRARPPRAFDEAPQHV